MPDLVQHVESECRHREEIHGGDGFAMIAQKGEPALPGHLPPQGMATSLPTISLTSLPHSAPTTIGCTSKHATTTKIEKLDRYGSKHLLMCRDVQRGFFAGFSYKRLDFTTYVFNAGWTDPTVVLAMGFKF